MGRNKKEIYIELLRIIAIIFVLMVHTDMNVGFYQDPSSSFVTVIISLFVSTVCNSAVPLFLMISGETLLGKNESIKDLFVKRILRFLIIIPLFSMIQYIAMIVMKGEMTFDIMFYFERLVEGNMTEQYWYLYAYLAFLISLPILRPLAMNLSDQGYRYLMLVTIAWNYIPRLLNTLTIFNTSWSINFFFDGQLIFYPLIGYYLGRKLTGDRLPKISVCELILSILIILNMGFELMIHNITGEWGLYNMSVMPITILIFVIFRILGARISSEKIRRVIAYLGSLSFGIYLVELIARRIWAHTYLKMCDATLGIVACCIYVFLSYVTGAVIAAVMKLIPGLKKLV
ncbi:MAG: acyltransferase family protein [Butyrivibrio sp.]|nr:acyltransferase family protein [Butyrivibrio sp.]